VIIACLEAGAKELRYLIDPPADFWSKSQFLAKYKAEIAPS